MIRFWDFQHSGAQPLLSCVVRPQVLEKYMAIPTDSGGNRQVEVDLPDNEKARVTLVPSSWGARGGVRIQ